ncbi:MAG: leucine-rich repeat protein [Bacteroidales bacterium]|nr:leucine-rich repeat protein [Bacteroidales bacterium]
MKKYYSILASAFAICFAACTSESVDDLSNSLIIGTPINLSITQGACLVGESPSTRTIVQNTSEVWWESGDEVAVFACDSNNDDMYFVSTLENGERAETSQFTGTLTVASDKYYVMYPCCYSFGTFDSGNNLIKLRNTVDSEQIARAGSFNKDEMPSLGSFTPSSLSFTMKQLCGGLKFNLSRSDIKSVTFESYGTDIIAGGFAVTDLESETPVINREDNGSIITLRPESGCFEAGVDYFVVMIPGSLNGFKATLTTSADEELVVVSTKLNTIKPGVFGTLAKPLDEYVKASEPSFNKYLMLTSEGTTTITIQGNANNCDAVLYYSYDTQTWQQWDYSPLSFTYDSPLYLCGDNYYGMSVTGIGGFATDGSNFSVYGDIMSLINHEEDVLAIPMDHCFADFFCGCTGLLHAPDLPALVLTDCCYESMFAQCPNLQQAPALPATTLAPGCYSGMFAGCTDLTQAPALPATSLANSCYASMFNKCANLTQASDLPASELAPSCYSGMFRECIKLTQAPSILATTYDESSCLGMFYGCSSLTQAPPTLGNSMCFESCKEMFKNCIKLTQAPVLPAMTLGKSCYEEMFYNCTELSSAPELPATSMAPRCYSDMFFDCKSITQAPALPATTLAPSCYQGLFLGCPITQAPELPASELAEGCYADMFSCTDLTQAPALPATTLAPNCYGGMFSHCTSLSNAPALPATTLAPSCYDGMFCECTDLTQAPALPATSMAACCYSGMFSHCTGLTNAPELPAMELAERCYYDMFAYCIKLSQAPALPATTLAEGCYAFMFDHCKQLEIAPVLPATTLPDFCYASMFQGCEELYCVNCNATDISAWACVDYWLHDVSPIGTFIKNPEMNSWPQGASGIPEGWTVQNAQ